MCWAPGGVHNRCPGTNTGSQQRRPARWRGDGGDQLPVHPQEAALQAPGACADQGGARAGLCRVQLLGTCTHGKPCSSCCILRWDRCTGRTGVIVVAYHVPSTTWTSGRAVSRHPRSSGLALEKPAGEYCRQPHRLAWRRQENTVAGSNASRHAQEITRRVNLRDIWQAAYTAGRVLPKPVASCQYWHRSLDPKKVSQSRFAPSSSDCLSAAIRLSVSQFVSAHASSDCSSTAMWLSAAYAASRLPSRHVLSARVHQSASRRFS